MYLGVLAILSASDVADLHYRPGTWTSKPISCGISPTRTPPGLGLTLRTSDADEREFTMLRTVLDAEDAIDAATFSGDVDTSKPAPDLVEAALSKIGIPAEEAVFVGDTVWDVQACQKVSVPCIGVLSGGFSRDELTSAGAAEIYPGPAELQAAFPESLLGRGKTHG